MWSFPQAQAEEENARRATTEILKTRPEAAQAPANFGIIKRLFESDSPAEREREEENVSQQGIRHHDIEGDALISSFASETQIRRSIRKATGIYWSRYLQFKTAAENGEVGADEKAKENLRRVIEVVKQKFVASDLEQTLRVRSFLCLLPSCTPSHYLTMYSSLTAMYPIRPIRTSLSTSTGSICHSRIATFTSIATATFIPGFALSKLL